MAITFAKVAFIFYTKNWIRFFLKISGLVHKLANHCEDFGVTDCICIHDGILLSSAYSLDSGLGYVNGKVQHIYFIVSNWRLILDG